MRILASKTGFNHCMIKYSILKDSLSSNPFLSDYYLCSFVGSYLPGALKILLTAFPCVQREILFRGLTLAIHSHNLYIKHLGQICYNSNGGL